MASSKTNAKETVLLLSRGTAIVLLLLYMLYLFFQLKSHASLFDEEAVQGAEDDDEEETRVLKPIPAGVALLLVTILVAVSADYLVESIDDVVASTNLSRTFIGLILLPIVGNAAEHVTAAMVAYKGKMDLAIGVALGSSLQIALFVTPAMVILGKPSNFQEPEFNSSRVDHSPAHDAALPQLRDGGILHQCSGGQLPHH
jgi:Ca2+:H+ antiporter